MIRTSHLLMLAMLFTTYFLMSCSQPIATSLLTSKRSEEATSTDTVDNSTIGLQADNAEMAVFIDDDDRVEITGSCTDLDIKDNYILVEAFAGEDQTTIPYISNSLSDLCQTTDSGIATGEKCFYVTNGIGRKEDLGLPTERTFPQCHNGRYGFAIRLGKILEDTASPGNYKKYSIRLKIRTIDGILTDSTWTNVTVERKLREPVISNVAYDLTGFKCTLDTLPARYNQDILYTLERTFTDAYNTNAGSQSLYVGLDTSAYTPGVSVFNWEDITNVSSYLIEGVTYNYTLVSSEAQYSYTTVPTKSSAVATCTTAKPAISMAGNPVGGRCYMVMTSTANPYWSSGDVVYEWGYSSTAPTWIGTNSNASAGFTVATCAGSGGVANSPVCTEQGLTSNVTYYFALRAKSADGSQTGKWSGIQSCRPP